MNECFNQLGHTQLCQIGEVLSEGSAGIHMIYIYPYIYVYISTTTQHSLSLSFSLSLSLSPFLLHRFQLVRF